MSDSMLVRMRAHMTRSLCSCMCTWSTRSTTGSRTQRDSAPQTATHTRDGLFQGDIQPGKVCLSQQASTWVHVKMAFHRLGDALQLDGLQGAVCMGGGGGEAAQRFPDEAGHLPNREDLQKLAINGGERPQEHRLRTSELRSVTTGWRMELKNHAGIKLCSTMHYVCVWPVWVCVCVRVRAPRCHRLTRISISRSYCCDENAD